jgi:hypothetical protein
MRASAREEPLSCESVPVKSHPAVGCGKPEAKPGGRRHFVMVGLLLAAALLGPPLRASTEPVVYVSDPQDGVVNAYLQSNPAQMVLQIQHLADPSWLYVDRKRQLFVVQNNGWIAGYKSGQTMFFTRFVNPEGRFGTPTGLCGDAAGHVFLTQSWDGGYVAEIDEYSIGDPHHIGGYSWEQEHFIDPSVSGCVGDAAGDLFANFYSYQGLQVLEFADPALSSNPVTVPVTYGGLAFDRRDNLLSASFTGSTTQIQAYAPPYTGQPIFTITGLPQFYQYALDGTGKHLWLLATANSAQQLAEYSYPGGNVEAVATLPFSPGGIALSPPVRP